jgi:integrase
LRPSHAKNSTGRHTRHATPPPKPTKQPMRKSKYRHLLDDPDVMRWFMNECRGSEITGRERLRRLGAICERFDVTPKELGRMKPKQAKDFLMDMVTKMEKADMKANYIRNFIKAAKSWLKYNENEVNVKIKISKRNRVLKYKKERPPTPDELKRILDAADVRRRAAIALVAFAGLRPQALGDYLGDDGLKIEDFPEMTISDGRADFNRIPTKIVVREVFSKAGHEYLTFLNEEGCEILKSYLEDRMRLKTRKKWSNGKWEPFQVPGEKLTPDTPVITPVQVGHIGKHIRTSNIGDLIRVAIRAAGYDWRPYVLRRYFDTRMMNAESDKLIIRDYRVFWMGHTGDIEAEYTVNKDLDRQTLEKLRDAYASADEAYLTTRQRREFSEEKAIAVFNRLQLRYAGYTDEEIAAHGDLSTLTPEQVQELVEKKGSHADSHSNGKASRQRVAAINELPDALARGWEFVSTLPNGQVIVRLPVS